MKIDLWSVLSKINGMLHRRAQPYGQILAEVEQCGDFDLLGDLIFGTLSYLKEGKIPDNPEERLLQLGQYRLVTKTLLSRSDLTIFVRQYVLFIEMLRGWIYYHLQARNVARVQKLCGETDEAASYKFGLSQSQIAEAFRILLHDINSIAGANLPPSVSHDEMAVLRSLEQLINGVLVDLIRNTSPIYLGEWERDVESAAVLLSGLLEDLDKPIEVRSYLACLEMLRILIGNERQEETCLRERQSALVLGQRQDEIHERAVLKIDETETKILWFLQDSREETLTLIVNSIYPLDLVIKALGNLHHKGLIEFFEEVGADDQWALAVIAPPDFDKLVYDSRTNSVTWADSAEIYVQLTQQGQALFERSWVDVLGVTRS